MPRTVTTDFKCMNIKTSSLLVVAERHFREHLKKKPRDDDEAAMLAIRGPLAYELGKDVAKTVLNDPALPSRLHKIRQTFHPGISI